MLTLATLWPATVNEYQSASPDGQRTRATVVGAAIDVACAALLLGSPASAPHCWIVNCSAWVAASSVVPATHVGPGSVQPYCAYQLEPASDGRVGVGRVDGGGPPQGIA